VLATNVPLVETMWQKREIENYLCQEEVLLRYARAKGSGDLFSIAETTQRENAMREAIAEVTAAQKIALGDFDPWSSEIKATDQFLDPLFRLYFSKLNLPNLLRKSSYYELARLVQKEGIDPEVIQKLDLIVQVYEAANPAYD